MKSPQIHKQCVLTFLVVTLRHAFAYDSNKLHCIEYIFGFANISSCKDVAWISEDRVCDLFDEEDKLAFQRRRHPDIRGIYYYVLLSCQTYEVYLL